jgi:hypothetical protein
MHQLTNLEIGLALWASLSSGFLFGYLLGQRNVWRKLRRLK